MNVCSGREESEKRVYATTQRRVIHEKLSSEMIPNAHALSFRNSGDIGGFWSMFKKRERVQPEEKTPARENGGGESASNTPTLIKGE